MNRSPAKSDRQRLKSFKSGREGLTTDFARVINEDFLAYITVIENTNVCSILLVDSMTCIMFENYHNTTFVVHLANHKITIRLN